jgi:hypothetical protein
MRIQTSQPSLSALVFEALEHRRHAGVRRKRIDWKTQDVFFHIRFGLMCAIACPYTRVKVWWLTAS